ncbi:PaaX family transcriptional regulator C-terminal domain-containing protein [Actinoplanes sp. ATCC 53533]|uniref:PaaX family transcriptional regulator n=1 Tax=Actinoplanes sp. ATCC 53533 TaxID=1288362 RepID=UPI001F3C295A|nr:PaaX family transcriptional regulator C-terminal domain-containing protein [Actinoplanes sp. ATCC 53533]
MTEPAESLPAEAQPRPQTLLLMLLGDFVLDQGVCVFSGSVIDTLARLGVSSHATRSTLTRMVGRDLLRRQRHGRKMYFGLTPRSTAILHDGRTRIWETGAVNDRWDGTWTLLCFSLPESWQRQRHDLRSQLTWAGFGPLQGGLWIAPGQASAQEIVSGLGLAAHARVFRARADELTDIATMVGDAYDLAGVAARYEGFLDRWDGQPPVSDPLAARLLMVAEWLGAIRRDPRLPVEHLPPGWPAVRAQKLFRELEAAGLEPARATAATLLDLRPDEDSGVS